MIKRKMILPISRHELMRRLFQASWRQVTDDVVVRQRIIYEHVKTDGNDARH